MPDGSPTTAAVDPLRPLSVAVVGAGWIGADHLSDLAARPDVRIVAVADQDLERARAHAEPYGASSYADHRSLLAGEELDAVWICTPPQHHLQPSLDSLAAGVPVYLEKPIARSRADAAEIVEAAGRSGLPCAIGYQWHAVEVLDELRGALAGQQIGCLLGQSIGPTQSRDWFLRRSQGGGNLLERGSHHIDLIRAVAGEVVAVQAIAGEVALSGRSVDGADIEDALTLVLQLATGAIATVVIAWTQPVAPHTYALDVLTTEGGYRLDLDPHFTVTGACATGSLSATSQNTPFHSSNSRFLDAVRSGDPTRVACTPSDAMRTLAVAAAGEQALATGQKVLVP